MLFPWEPVRRSIDFTRQVLRDLSRTSRVTGTPDEHLAAAVEWLKRAHDASPDEGVSWGYSLKGGWRQVSYRETSGYIAATLFDLAEHLGDLDARQRAIRICRWLVQVQNADGGFSNPNYGNDGIVFDTGQALQGLVRGATETGDEELAAAAERAGDWLTQVADENGHWTRHTHNGIPHVYNTRTAWILLQLNQLRPKPDHERVARANLDWALRQQQPSGLFEQCAFVAGKAPFTHTIAYALQGLLESSEILSDLRYQESALRGAQAVRAHLRADGFLPGQISPSGKPTRHYCCLTGNCQMAIVWFRLYERTNDATYLDAARRAVHYVMARQELRSVHPNVRGGIPGSHPIWARYAPLSYPNWAAKFLIDAMLRLRAREKLGCQ